MYTEDAVSSAPSVDPWRRCVKRRRTFRPLGTERYGMNKRLEERQFLVVAPPALVPPKVHLEVRTEPLDKEPPGILVEVRAELFQRGVGVTGSRRR